MVSAKSIWALALAALCIPGAALMTAQGSAPKAEKIDFNRDIRPILSKCSSCHGPTSGEGLGGLRIDSFKTATIKLKSGHTAIVPGNPEASELIRRVTSTDPAVLMPPPDTHRVLKAEEKQLLRDWIAQGAEYKEHWAFVKPVRPPLPKVQDGKWPKNGIDNFVLAKLEEKGLHPEKEADRATLIRRVSFDITGLPPTPAEVDAFVQDKSKDAYEKVVDRLLASPRYGERMAMDWMDLARYADSNGYQADFERYQSRWRDWVIEAFNKNMPYDEFTVDQIAGDLLPNATMDQKLATAFNRNHRINTEGGVIAEEWRVEGVIDRVETTTAVWLGLTAGCARCHDHKYDPISQKDFYQLFAYFNNVPESGTGEERPVNHPPLMSAPTPEQTSHLADVKKALASLESKMNAKLASNSGKTKDWTLTEPVPTVPQSLVARYKFAPESQLKSEGAVKYEAGRATGAVITDDKSFIDLGDAGDFERTQPFSFGAWIRPTKADGAPIARMDSVNGFRGWEFSLNGGIPQSHLINMWPQNAFKVQAKTARVMPGKWTHVFITYDGSSKAAGMKMYLDGKSVELDVPQDTLSETIKTTVSTKIGRRTSSEMYSGAVDDFVLYDRALTPEEVAHLADVHPAAALLTIPEASRTKEQQQEIVRLWSLDHDPAFKNLDGEVGKMTSERDAVTAAIPNVMVMEEMPKPRDCFVLVRGLYDKHGDKVEAGLPSFLPPMPKNAPNNRLGLAEWIVSPENPLTARVTVNRLWERLFGTGIVSTVEDFGTRADFPTNPALLDYLATEFIRLKWDLKAMMKELVMSSTYRQSSDITPQKLKADPLNTLLSRGPRFRLTGEMIRDQALLVSGLLVEKLGGPSVRPYQPAGIWDETNFYGNLRNYTHDKGDGLYRRSLYTIWKRTAAPPNMLLFDVPPREACRVRRARTDTPLQALTLLNDETYLEASRVLAQKMMREGGTTPESRLAYGFKRVLAREPSPAELKLLAAGVAKRIVAYRANPEGAKDVVFIGDAPIDLGLDRAELAAYTVAASTMMNLDEAVTKD